MPTIKTGEWLKITLAKEGMTQKQLAIKAGLSLPAISKIILGERIGSLETWDKILSIVDGGVNVSVASSEFISELEEEIEEYGEEYIINVFYKTNRGNIIFSDYLLDEDMKENYKDDLEQMNMLRISLKEALKLFKAQDEIFR